MPIDEFRPHEVKMHMVSVKATPLINTVEKTQYIEHTYTTYIVLGSVQYFCGQTWDGCVCGCAFDAKKIVGCMLVMWVESRKSY